jgi:hypothetical protein
VPRSFHYEETYEFVPGEAEFTGPATLANGIVIGPDEVVDADGTRHPAPKRPKSTGKPGWTGYGPRTDLPK